MKLDLTREPVVQRAVINVYSAFGCEVRRFADYTPGRHTRVSKGWPDLAIFSRQKRCMWFHEVKTSQGQQSPEQSSTQRLIEDCGLDYVLGGVHEAEAQLRKLGIIAAPGTYTGDVQSWALGLHK